MQHKMQHKDFQAVYLSRFTRFYEGFESHPFRQLFTTVALQNAENGLSEQQQRLHRARRCQRKQVLRLA